MRARQRTARFGRKSARDRAPAPRQVGDREAQQQERKAGPKADTSTVEPTFLPPEDDASVVTGTRAWTPRCQRAVCRADFEEQPYLASPHAPWRPRVLPRPSGPRAAKPSTGLDIKHPCGLPSTRSGCSTRLTHRGRGQLRSTRPRGQALKKRAKHEKLRISIPLPLGASKHLIAARPTQHWRAFAADSRFAEGSMLKPCYGD